MITNLTVDSGSWRSSYVSTINLKFATRQAKAVIYNIEGLGSRDKLAVVLFENNGKCNFQFRIIDTFYQEGVEPEILSIFNVNADKDKELELAVLIGWHYDDLNFRGYLYKVSVYDYPKTGKNDRFSQIQRARELFPIEGDGLQMNKRLHAKYNTEAKIRRRLKQLGYKQ